MTVTDTSSTVDWESLRRPVPAWFQDAKFGIFIHWGAYSVPAWAEPSGQLGELDDEVFFARNPYSEWYFNSMRIAGSPTVEYHLHEYGDAPYDDFLDNWHAENFDPSDLVDLFARAGARYVVPTTKHHDGITLWPAPGTGTRNTLDRGPRRDLIGELHDAARAAGMRFGTYYSGGLDWHAAPTPPIVSQHTMYETRPRTSGYASYAHGHVADLIERYRPDVLWNDIEWPDAGKALGEQGLQDLFARYRAAVPEGVVNDRWGVPFHDYRTSEYHLGLEKESGPAWEHCRGLGYSFGYNQREGADQYLDTGAVVRLLADIVSRGGTLLLNVGPKADGTLPREQRAVLEGVADWMHGGSDAIHATRPPADLACNTDDPWVRWTVGESSVFAIVDGLGTRPTHIPSEADPETARPRGIHRDGIPSIIEYDRRSL